MITNYTSDLLPEKFLQKYINKEVPWGFNGLGYIVYKRTYARKIEGTDQTEEWWQTVARCINGAQEIGADYTSQEAQRLYDLVYNLKCNFAGRMLWQLGTETVKKFGANSLLNCWYCSINDPKTFLFIFENLMLGGGVGFSIRREDIHELPKIKKGVVVEHQCTKDADFIVPDSRSGWVELLRKVLDAYYVNGKSFSFSTILVRGAGERIAGFGGTASGPGILIEGIEKISKIFQSREGKKLRSTDVLDICNIIGSVVVAGNVRRSAQIALGDPDDYLYLRAKNWSFGNIPNWRAMSNNTIYADDFSHISSEIWTNGYIVDKETGFAKGEPYGFFNLPLSQKFGRLKDGQMKTSKLYPTNEDNVQGTNPCAEISLNSYECCNLSELYLNNISSAEELVDCATLLYKTQKATAAMPFIHDETNKIVHKNMRLGLGVTGICQCSDEKIGWLDKGYEALRKFDKEWSKTKGYPESIKLTTVKPSGTLSLLAGSTPGVHPAYSPFYIRRVRMGSGDRAC
jgi:ribonucleoside-triphosphate reductase (thioredoxin)